MLAVQEARTGNTIDVLIFPSTDLCFCKSIKVCAGMQHTQVTADKNTDIKGNRTGFSPQAQYCLVTTNWTALTISALTQLHPSEHWKSPAKSGTATGVSESLGFRKTKQTSWPSRRGVAVGFAEELQSIIFRGLASNLSSSPEQIKMLQGHDFWVS